jgi:hypothetical protein
VATDKCISTDPCVTAGCGVSGCTFTNKVCTPPNGCYTASCDSASGNCVYADFCDDNDLCTADSCVGGACQHISTNCDDGKKCTENTCNPTTGTCSSSPLTCDDGIECTKDICDPSTGCSNTPDDTICHSPDPCVISKCVKSVGCVSSNFTCPPTKYVCLFSTCVAYEGCANQSVVCPGNNKTCTVTSCVEDSKTTTPCHTEELTCAAIGDTTQVVIAAVASTVSAAIIGAIIAAVVICGGIGAGGAFAYYSKSGDSGFASVTNNPMFVAKGTEGTNPLARV